MKVQVQMQIFKKANGYKPWLYKINIDVCKFLQKAYNPVAILVYRFLKDFLMYNSSCPVVVYVHIYPNAF